ncbi:Short-chain dehydrogenase/reductase family protein [Mycena indigotica]|uniref:Short-chain dehydrogenase/reductase family protein n=1 Tax=Mycena indigotica TaxID=2126181 RepID=A0A8H6TGK2_9AGAR|nr:Short-chain dehydrogenase/reductase family protein [Mycena indigotica]XP_037226356.1 Short-chain dehydrogenase/reductase family protein [Mycena indigotica]KAF7316332.1 Short-chain dehydrogenase/reductase family protein [Mycena indigotica]KAF7316333.1 Short-chain dehydrogenase/reductase family protein [Mycena indigotica]
MATTPVFLITGCSSGLGYEMSRAALDRGFRVIATARRVETLQTLKEQGATILSLDVTAPAADLVTFAQKAWEIYGQVDYLVNNAGYVQGGAIEENTPEETQKQFNTNVFGVLNLTNAFLPYLRKRRSGTLVNISSMGGSLSLVGAGVYCASKAAIDSFSETWSKELADFSVRCISIQPGMFRTPVSNSTNSQRGSRHIPEYIAANETMVGYNAQTGTERGDPAKGAARIVEFVTQTNEDLPFRLAIGPDAFDNVRGAFEKRIAEMDRFKEWSMGTDFEDYVADPAAYTI